MKTRRIARSTLIVLVSILWGAPAGAVGITGFTPIGQKGDCKIKGAVGYEKIVDKKRYEFGRTVKTGRNSFLDLQFSVGNTFRLLARTTVTITEDVKNPKLKVIQLTGGSLDLKMDDYPKDHKLEVETPSAICGAVGTRFKVSFEDPDVGSAEVASGPGSRAHRFVCDTGEVTVASRFSVGDEVVVAKTFSVESFTTGSDMVAVIHESGGNAFTDVTVNRGRLRFNYGGEDGVVFDVESAPGDDKPPRFTAALSKKADGTTFVAIKMIRGNANFLFFGGSANSAKLTPQMQAALVPTRPSVEGEVEIVVGGSGGEAAESFIGKAQKAGELTAQVTDAKAAGAPEAEIKALETQAEQADQEATETKASAEPFVIGELRSTETSEEDTGEGEDTDEAEDEGEEDTTDDADDTSEDDSADEDTTDESEDTSEEDTTDEADGTDDAEGGDGKDDGTGEDTDTDTDTTDSDSDTTDTDTDTTTDATDSDTDTTDTTTDATDTGPDTSSDTSTDTGPDTDTSSTSDSTTDTTSTTTTDTTGPPTTVDTTSTTTTDVTSTSTTTPNILQPRIIVCRQVSPSVFQQLNIFSDQRRTGDQVGKCADLIVTVCREVSTNVFETRTIFKTARLASDLSGNCSAVLETVCRLVNCADPLKTLTVPDGAQTFCFRQLMIPPSRVQSSDSPGPCPVAPPPVSPVRP